MMLSIYADRPWVMPWNNLDNEVDALQSELIQLIIDDDQSTLFRRFDLHLTLAWLFHKSGTTLGQKQAEDALTIARHLGDQLREADALHALATIYLNEHSSAPLPGEEDIHPTIEECRAAQYMHEQALQIREQVLGPDHIEVARSLLYIIGMGRLWGPVTPYIPFAERAVQICERELGSDHALTLVAHEYLARFQQFAKRLH